MIVDDKKFHNSPNLCSKTLIYFGEKNEEAPFFDVADSSVSF